MVLNKKADMPIAKAATFLLFCIFFCILLALYASADWVTYDDFLGSSVNTSLWNLSGNGQSVTGGNLIIDAGTGGWNVYTGVSASNGFNITEYSKIRVKIKNIGSGNYGFVSFGNGNGTGSNGELWDGAKATPLGTGTFENYNLYNAIQFSVGSVAYSYNTWYWAELQFNTDGIMNLSIWNDTAGVPDSVIMFDDAFNGSFQSGFVYMNIGDWNGDPDEIYIDIVELYERNIISENFSITANNSYSGDSITSFTAIVDGTEYNTTTGTVTTGILDNSTSLHNITIIATDYFNKTYTDYNVSIDLAAELYQSEISFNAYELFTNNSLTGVDFYISGLNQSIFYLSVGNHNVTAVKNGYYNLTEEITVTALDNTTLNIEGLYNAIANITVLEGVGGSTISSFTISDNESRNTSTSSGYIDLPMLQNRSLNFNVTASGYASIIDYNITVNSTYEQYNLTTYTFNSVRLNIYKESDYTLIDDTNVTINVISNSSSEINITETGFILIDFLAPNDYELRFSAEGYNPISKFVTVTNDSTQNITVYMTANDTTELQIIEVLDTANQPVEGAIVWLQKEVVNGSTQWVTIQEAQTNYDGETTLWVERSTTIFYRFAVIVDGVARAIQPSGNTFTSKTTFIPGISETIQLIIELEEDPDDYIGDNLAITTSVYYTNDNNTINFEFLDGRNSITGGKLVIQGKYLNSSLDYEDIAELTETGSSGLINYTFPIQNNTVYKITAYVTYSDSEVIVWEGLKIYDINVIVEKNTGLLYLAFLMALIALITARYGPLWSSLAVVGVMLPMSYLHFVFIPTAIITSLIAFMIWLYFRVRKR